MKEENKKPEDDSLEDKSTVINPTETSKAGAENNQIQESESLSQDSGEASSTLVKPNKPRSGLKRITAFANLYFFIFVLLFLIVGGGIFASLKLSDKGADNNPPTAKSLTDKQIAALKGSTTLVGDAQQTLDIQGNTVFEGQVLMRGSLDVAGSIKVGGTLSLPAITVGGTSSFGQIQINDTLSVNGNTTLQGQLSVQKGLTVAGATTFATLSASQLSVGSLQLTGDLVISRHISTSGGAPSKSNGSALGGSGTVSVNGTDTAGTVTVNTGGSPPAGCFVTINFTNRFTSTPHVIISPSNSGAAGLNYYSNRSNTNMSICSANTPTASSTYLFDYIIIN